MSRDSSATYIHMHSARLADLFEEFCRPPSSTPTNQTNTANPGAFNVNTSAQSTGLNQQTGMVQLPGHFLPFEEIALPSHLMPVNPEDEDGVVPDMHAAFGINRALGQNGVGSGNGGGDGGDAGAGTQREPVWRDLGLEGLLDRVPSTSGPSVTTSSARREGKKTGVLLLR